MGRRTVLLGFSLVGFAIGFFGFLAAPGFADWLATVLPILFSSRYVVGAFLAGIAGSIVSTVSVILWSYLSR
jgi:hypothetical protein